MQNNLNDLLTVEELAAKLHIKKKAVYGLTAKKHQTGLPIWGRIGQRLYFSEKQVAEFMQNRIDNYSYKHMRIG